MRSLFHMLLTFATMLVFGTAAYASSSQITFTDVTGTGSYHNGLDNLTDGVIPVEGTQWSIESTWSTGAKEAHGPNNKNSTVYTFDMGSLYTVQDITLSVDNNDSYVVEYSANGTDWSNLFTISKDYGDVTMGQDTFSTDSDNAQYLSALDFDSVEAQYLRIYWASGDKCYSVGEFQAYGLANASTSIAATPIPGAVWLLGSGLIALVGLRKRRRN